MRRFPPARSLLTNLSRCLLSWEPRRLQVWQRVGLAIVLTLLAAWLRIALAPAESGGSFITLSLAVAVSALVGGFGAGMVSTVLGMLLVNYFLIKPYGSLAIHNLAEAFWLNLWHFITELVVVSAIWLMQTRNRHLKTLTQQVKRNQQQFLATFEHAASGIAHTALDGRLLRVNPHFCHLVGYTAAELQQRPFQSITHPDDIGPDLALLEQTLSGQRTSYSLEKRYLHKDGLTVWAQLTVALMRTPDGEPDYLISVVQDLRAQKAAEDALRTSKRLMNEAQNLAKVGAWQADLTNGRISSIPKDQPFLSFPASDYAFEDMLSMIHPEDCPRVKTLWPMAIKGLATYQIEYRVLLQGREYWHSVKAEFERDGQGRAVGALGVTQDITERKGIELEVQRLNVTLEEQIHERTRALKNAYDDLESYSYAVAHDLRSPLRIINGFAQALEEDNPTLSEASQAHLQRIKSSSGKMGQLIDGLLRLSQYARGEVQRVPVNLSHLATRQLEELATADPGRRVDWEVEPELEVLADPALIEAVMQNLLHNAWKYTAEVPDAHIRVFSQDAEGHRHYCVNDNGAGFDMARADKLFQPFQRLHQPHEFAGLGIGLATARRIVQRHGGTMRAEGTPGLGATFCFTLPDGVE